MSFERLLSGTLTGLLAFVCLKFPVWGMIALERKLDTYPIVSQETVASLDEMRMALKDFDEACETHQAGERDAMNGVEEYVHEFEFENPSELIESATADMYSAVAQRKALAAKADWGLLKSMTLGAQAYTHSTWLCAPPYASFTTQISHAHL